MVNDLPGAKAFRWLAVFVLAAALAACGGGGSEPAGLLEQASTKASCSFQHLYITVERVQIRGQGSGGEQWTEIALTAPQRIDLMNPGGGVLGALGTAPLAAGHYTEVRLILAPNDDDSGLANAVQPTGGSPAALDVPSGAQSGLKLKGDFVVPSGQTGDVVLQGFDPCEVVVQSGNRNSPRYQLKPEMPASVQLDVAAPETPAASGAAISLIGGGYVQSRLQGTSTWVFQRYGADGRPEGGETTVAPALGPDDSAFVIAPLSGGGYAATWLRLVQFERLGGSLYDVMTQSFSAAGAAIGSPLAIGQTIPARYWISRPIALPKIAALAGGGYVVVWALPSHTDSGVYAQRFNADGSPAAAVHQVTPDGAGYLNVTGLTTGGYMVTWGSAGPAGHVRAYSSADAPLGPAQPAGPGWSDFFVGGGEPAFISPLAGGGAVMVWVRFESSPSSTPYVHVLQLAPDATPLANARIVDGSTAPANGHSAAAVTGLADGGYVVAWIEAGEVHARRFAADGTPAGEETRINLVTASAEPPVALVTIAGGGFMISWSGAGADGVRSIYSRVFPAGGLTG
jgi:hypothetical protein